jgi:hypothetical protein
MSNAALHDIVQTKGRDAKKRLQTASVGGIRTERLAFFKAKSATKVRDCYAAQRLKLHLYSCVVCAFFCFHDGKTKPKALYLV